METNVVLRRRLGAADQSVGEGAGPQRGPVVAIVGAGFSGTMAAVHLQRTLGPGVTICLFDRTGRFARGPAYAASSAPHLLNVRAANMSAFPDEPDHFDRWVEDHVARVEADCDELVRTPAGNFATRRLYGRYLRQLLFREMTQSGGRVLLAGTAVARIDPAGAGSRLTCANGRSVAAAAVVLASGNLASQHSDDGLVFHDPWADRAAAGLRPDAPVLIAGTGLTMVDLALGMQARGFTGPIVAVSRRGLVAHRHEPQHAAWPAFAPSATERQSLTALLRRLRAEVAAAASAGIGWRAVIDGLRPVTAELWRSLPASEQRRFLRHGRALWDVHRHRMAPPVADAFAALRDTGALRVQRGRVAKVERHGEMARVTVTGPRSAGLGGAGLGGTGLGGTGLGGTGATFDVQRLIYATGARPADEADALIASLCAGGLVQIDPARLGVCVDSELRVLAKDGQGRSMWALGPLVRGTFWESTAVPDIRRQARLIAGAIAGQLVSADA